MPLDCTSAGRRAHTSVNQLKVPRIFLSHQDQQAQAHERSYFITGAKVLQLQANLRYPVQQHFTRVTCALIVLPYLAAATFTGVFILREKLKV